MQTQEKNMTYKGKLFSFYILNDEDSMAIAFRSDSHKPITNKEELRKLAISILSYLENN